MNQKRTRIDALIKVAGALLALGAFLLSVFLPLNALPPAAALLTLPKMLAAALAPYTGSGAIIGVALALFAERRQLTRRKNGENNVRSLGFGTLAIVVAGLVAGALSLNYMLRVTAPHDGFERAFGANWQSKISPELSSGMLAKRWTWQLPGSPEPHIEKDVLVGTIPGSDRQLTANIWRPAEGVNPSGLAYLYVNMGGWQALDKNLTFPMFRHVAGQGHIVVDFVSRQRPETDIAGMVSDIKRAIVWLKSEGKQYGISPERIVIAGGSAGGNLALLTAYTPDHPELTPDDLKGADASVRAAVGFYAASDLWTYYEVEGRRAQNLLDRLGDEFYKRAASSEKLGVGETTDRMLTQILGGLPDQVPAMYDLGSPINHVRQESPATLLFHGEHDPAAPTVASRLLYRKLLDAGVPAIYHEMPWNEHAYDVILPQLSPSAQATFYDLERFLALMAGENES